MRTLALYLGVCAVPGAAFAVLERWYRAWTGQTPWRHPRDTREPAGPIHPPLERIAADLHRLGEEQDRTRRTGEPARMHRLTAVSLAYDDTLRLACAELDVPAPETGPLQDGDRLRIEAELARAGLSW